jgi:signal transduction histidine kinase
MTFIDNTINTILFGKTRKISVISIVLIVVISYAGFFYLQGDTENKIENSLFEQQKERQIQITKAISQHISSDLDSIMIRLKVLGDSVSGQQGDLSSNNTKRIMNDTYFQINKIASADRLFILDKDDNVAAINITSKEKNAFLDTTTKLSNTNWIRETKSKLLPIFSNGLKGEDGKYRIAISYPVVDKYSTRYMGMVGALLPAVDFFQHYGNIYDIKSQYIAVLDSDSVQLVHPLKTLVGTPFFGNYTQEATGYNKILNNVIKTVIAGKPAFAVYDFKNGQRLNTGYPIFLQGKPTYSIFIITPTSSIYSQINNVITTEKIEMFSLLAGITVAIVVLMLVIIKWSNILDKEVKRRTKELDKSNQLLELANQQLKIHDSMQKEFINIASHEMRTPTQAILGYSEMSEMEPERSKEYLQPILRNARRLQTLTNDILDVTRIESQSLNLNKERVNLDDVISSVLVDYLNQIERERNQKDIKLVYENNDDNKPRDIFVEADRERLTQVISNLISNAIKFTQEGVIKVSVEVKDNRDAVITIKDNGEGIDSEIMPRLFTKFATKSIMGTGLGLFISKSIVDAHGGKIWGENNKDGRGATFTFSLPLSKK